MNKARTESVVNTLTRLRAVRWLGPVKPEYGFDKPSATFKFGSTSDPKINGRLVLGGQNAAHETYAQTDGKPGACLVTLPDDTVLTGGTDSRHRLDPAADAVGYGCPGAAGKAGTDSNGNAGADGNAGFNT